MKKYLFLLTVLLFLAATVNAQQSTLWVKFGSFGGGSGDGTNSARTIGGLLAVGEITDGTIINYSEILFRNYQLLDVEDDENILPREFSLAQNYPNPFNPSTTIKFSLPRTAVVEISIYNILGRKVATLVNETRSAGEYSIRWDGVDGNGSSVATGIYFYRINAGDFVSTKKMMLLK